MKEIARRTISSEMVCFSECELIQLVQWLNTIPSVTDFEALCLNLVEKTARRNGLCTQRVGGQLVLGRASTRFRLLAHADRVGFVLAPPQVVEESKEIELKYAPGSKIEVTLLTKRFQNSFLKAFDPKTGKPLFWCVATKSSNEEKFLAKVVDVLGRSRLKVRESIPLTAVGPNINRYGQYLVGSFDNSVGLALALKLVAEMPHVFSCVVTTEEEGPGYERVEQRGGRGARKYIHHHNLSQILVVSDVRPSSIVENETKVGKGVVLRISEERETPKGRIPVVSAVPRILNYLQNYATRNSIPFQTYKGLGVTEAGRAQEEIGSDKLKCIWIQPPVANNHTPNEIMSISDITNALTLARSLSYYNE